MWSHAALAADSELDCLRAMSTAAPRFCTTLTNSFLSLRSPFITNLYDQIIMFKLLSMREEVNIPFLVGDELPDGLLALLGLDGGVAGVRELRGGVVPPNDCVLDVSDVHAQLLGDLPEGAVVVQPREAGDVLGGDRRRKLLEHERVRVGRVRHDQNLQNS